MDDYLFAFGISIMFGLSFIMTILTFKDMESFFLWLCIFSGFVVWAGFLPLWVLIATFLLVGIMLVNKIRKGANG